ncbi:MAG TPA: hypothetical protein VD789_04160 [Thermomicrobiales bacterium]|nr:hypothetical protein [Thermomicrobiales bacterium]
MGVRVAISPEDVDAVANVAQAVITQLHNDHDIIWLFYYFTAEAATARLHAELQALYIRHDI